MKIKNETVRSKLQSDIAELDRKTSEFKTRFNVYQANKAEQAREKAVLSAIENEISETQNFIQNAGKQDKIPTFEEYLEAAKKEAELSARKKYIQLFLADCEIQDKKCAIELSPMRSEIDAKRDNIRLEYAKQLCEETLASVAENLKIALVCFRRSQSVYEKAKELSGYNPSQECNYKTLFLDELNKHIEKILEIDEHFEDDLLTQTAPADELFDFEYISATKAHRYRIEIEQHYQKTNQ